MAANPEPGVLDVVVGPMQRRHLKAVIRIETAVYPRPWSMSLFMSELALTSSRAYFVAKVDRHVVGYAGIMMSDADGHITTIAVDPDWHRQRIGTALMVAATREAVRRGAASLTLEVRVANKGAQAMYARFGFLPVGVRRNYYQETNEDALVMWADDVDTPGYRRRLDGIEESIPGSMVVELDEDWS